MKATRRRTPTTKPKKKLTKKKLTKPRAPRKSVPPAPQPSPPVPLVDPEAEMLLRIAEQEQLAKRRVAALMERTLNVPWMRSRVGSFETALLGGLRNLLAESAKDLAEGRSHESREAICFFLFGLLSSLRTVFYREAMSARIPVLSAERGRLTPTDEDTSDAVFEARIYNNAAQREVALEKFRALLALTSSAGPTNADRLMEQARTYDLLNTAKGIPKA